MPQNPWDFLGIYEPSQPRKQEAAAVRAVAEVSASPRALSGGRATIDREQDIFASALTVLSPLSSDELWRSGGLDSRTLDRIPINKLVELLADLSPDVSKALWDFLRFCNPGYEWNVYKVGTKDTTKVIDQVGQKAIADFISQLHGPYTVNNVIPLDVIIGSMYIAIFLRGALCTELVLNEAGDMPLEIATPDPGTIKARRVVDAERGFVWQLGQWQRSGIFVPIDKPTVCFVPIDPLPGDWKGRALAAPAVFSCLFLIGLLHDLRRVIAQQGYPRLDLSIDFEKLLQVMPKNLNENSEAKLEWIKKLEAAIAEAYAQLQPDDAYVHSSIVSVGRPVGTLDASSLRGSEGIIAALERFGVRALKTMPFLMGINESTTETLANRQYEAHIGGIRAIQHIPEFVLTRQFGLVLQVQGLQGDVVFKFAEQRAAEELRDEQVSFWRIRNARMLYDNGSINADEMAKRSCGKATADVPAPRAVIGAGSEPKTQIPDPGANRSLPVSEQLVPIM